MTDEEIGALFEDRLPRARTKSVLRHLLGCGACKLKLVNYQEPLGSGAGAVAFGPRRFPADRAVAVLLKEQAAFWQAEDERRRKLVAELPSQCEGLLSLPEELKKEFRGWAQVEASLERSRAERFREPGRMIDWAFLAVLAARNLDRGIYGEALSWDLQAKGWTELANAFRVGEDFQSAEDALVHGVDSYDRGTGDRHILARLIDVEASLRTDQRRLRDALELLGHLRALYEGLGDRHLVGRTLISMGINTYYIGRPDEAVSLLEKGVGEIDGKRDPELLAIGTKALLDALAVSGRYGDAGRLLLASGLREAFASEPLKLAKLRWVEGRIFLGLGNLARAEQFYLEVRQCFGQFGRDYERATAGLDLASVWLRQGKNGQVRELAEELVATFERVGVRSEALKAVRFFREACRRERATPALVEAIVLFLERLDWQPQLKFSAGEW